MSEVAVNSAPGETGSLSGGGQLSREQARVLTATIRITGEPKVWELIAEAYSYGAWSALGHRTWRAYCNNELGGGFRPWYGHSPSVVNLLHEAGLSTRAIAVVTGLNRAGVSRVLAKLSSTKGSDAPRSGDLPPSRSDPTPDPVPALDPAPHLTQDAAPIPARYLPDPERLDSLVYNLKGMCIALDHYARARVELDLDGDQAERWAKELDNSATSLRRFSSHLKERIRAN